MDRNSEANMIADLLVYRDHRRWRRTFSINMLVLRDLISQAMKDHAEVCVRDAIRKAKEMSDA